MMSLGSFQCFADIRLATAQLKLSAFGMEAIILQLWVVCSISVLLVFCDGGDTVQRVRIATLELNPTSDVVDRLV